mgnify:CR=1 FL=1
MGEEFKPEFRPFTLEEGGKIINTVRAMLEDMFGKKHTPPPPIQFTAKGLGMWLAVEKIRKDNFGYNRRVLRAHVGSPYPITDSLYEDLVILTRRIADGGLNASPLSAGELPRLVIEVAFNNTPITTTVDDLVKVFKPGYHGLLVKRPNGGIEAYLPHRFIAIAEELKQKGITINNSSLIREACKAGCSEVKVFETQIFYEVVPGGEVIERKLYLNRVFKGR